MGLVCLIAGAGVLLYQGVTLIGLLPIQMVSLLNGKNNYLDLLSAVVCKWGVPLGAVSMLLGIVAFFDKKDELHIRGFASAVGYAMLVVAILSVL